MEVEIRIEEGGKPHAVIFTPEMTEEVSRIVSYIRDNSGTLPGRLDDRVYVLKAADIIKVEVEGEHTVLCTQDRRYQSDRRLYELRRMLGEGFVQISKSVIVRISACESMETDFGGALLLRLRDGSREYVSRHYLPEFRKSIGM